MVYLASMPVTSVKVSTIWWQLSISSYMAMTVSRYFSGSRNAAATAREEAHRVGVAATDPKRSFTRLRGWVQRTSPLALVTH